MKKVLAFTAFFVCFVVSVVAVYWKPIMSVMRGPKPGAIFQQKLVESGKTRVRVLALREEGGFMPALNGAYYKFEVSAESSVKWKEVMTARHDDPIPIPENWVGIGGPNSIVIFMNYEYAVSLDGGETWKRHSLWDTYPKGDECLYNCIRTMEIRPDGKGTAVLDLVSGLDDQVTHIETTDFGGHWTDASRHQ
ncbi:MAG TPA: hypothetical protein VMM38_12250 [Aridibacter sp.]|nr:hypothetical protein [Aridibacter sp.]